MQKRRNPMLPFIIIVIMGVIGGAIGGIYFFMSQDSEPETPVLDLPPAFTPQPTSAESEATGTEEAVMQDFPYILIPAAQLEEVIVTSYLKPEGWQIDHLGNRVGHLEGTAWLGDANGNIVLAGHVELADGRRGAFANIDDMAVGDDVTIREKGVEYHYRVTEIKEVAPDDMSVVYPTETPRLTLITCSDYNLLSNKYESRTIIIAERVS